MESLVESLVESQVALLVESLWWRLYHDIAAGAARHWASDVARDPIARIDVEGQPQVDRRLVLCRRATREEPLCAARLHTLRACRDGMGVRAGRELSHCELSQTFLCVHCADETPCGKGEDGSAFFPAACVPVCACAGA